LPAGEIRIGLRPPDLKVKAGFRLFVSEIGVDINGLMTVLGKPLYSTPMVAIRELVQNAHDSITRRRLEDPDWDGPARIDVIPGRTGCTLRIVDTGAGLTEHEIHA
jgi:molecular chaperone HtpG